MSCWRKRNVEKWCKLCFLSSLSDSRPHSSRNPVIHHPRSWTTSLNTLCNWLDMPVENCYSWRYRSRCILCWFILVTPLMSGNQGKLSVELRMETGLALSKAWLPRDCHYRRKEAMSWTINVPAGMIRSSPRRCQYNSYLSAWDVYRVAAAFEGCLRWVEGFLFLLFF